MGNSRRGSSSKNDIHTAARTGDIHAIQSICTSNPLSINSRDKHSRTPLHLAAWAGQTEVVSYLCKHKADVSAAAMDDMGAIHFAAQKGHLEIVRILLSSGVSVKAFTRKGLTPLHYAVQGSHLDLTKYLVKKGSSLSTKTKAGKTPLDLANSDEIHSFLVECEETSKKQEEPTVSKEIEGSSPKQSDKDNNVNSNDEGIAKDDIEGDGSEGKKRKGEETITKGILSEPKKPRVALNHLLAGDDMPEEEEE
ncbi:ankyrin repeat family protein [Tasmannia lanceolata]|uniref:ankyrin repeat family protein n=1 Tax=Tasmannia lanceolata TaxID=3420 RepID=UPI0040649081